MAEPNKLEKADLKFRGRFTLIFTGGSYVAVAGMVAVWSVEGLLVDSTLTAKIIATFMLVLIFAACFLLGIYGFYEIGLIKGARKWAEGLPDILERFEQSVQERRQKIEEQLR